MKLPWARPLPWILAGIAIASALCWFVLEDNARPDRQQGPPNVVLVITDDQAFEDPELETPIIDSLANDGMRFTQFRVRPICSPTRASLLSGLQPLEHGLWRGPTGERAASKGRKIQPSLHPDVQLLPSLLSEAGYATGLFGKWHLGDEPHNLPNARGFDQFVGFLSGAHEYTKHVQSEFLKNGESFTTEEHPTDLFTNEAIDFIRAHRDEPFFCCVAYNAPHGPLQKKPRDRASAPPEWIAATTARGLQPPCRDYAALLEHVDHSIGRLRDELASEGLLHNTLFIYLSDNGPADGQSCWSGGQSLHGFKGSVYDGGLRVPAFVHWPAIVPGGSESGAKLVDLDLLPTILAATESAVPATNGPFPVRGLSLLPHLRSGAAIDLEPRSLFWCFDKQVAMIRDDWKAVVGLASSVQLQDVEQLRQWLLNAPLELYDLSNDPGERLDVSAEHEDLCAELRAELISWIGSGNS